MGRFRSCFLRASLSQCSPASLPPELLGVGVLAGLPAALRLTGSSSSPREKNWPEPEDAWGGHLGPKIFYCVFCSRWARWGGSRGGWPGPTGSRCGRYSGAWTPAGAGAGAGAGGASAGAGGASAGARGWG